MTDHSGSPDYDLPEALDLTEPQQYRALFEPTRTDIVTLLLERAATTSDLAEALGKPKGTIGHHLKVLADAGLVRVVRTEKVRALEAKYYGRTARTFYYQRLGEAVGNEHRILTRAAAEVAAVPDHGTDQVFGAGLRYARIPAERAAEWHRRLADLLVEFAAEPRGGETTYGAVFALYPTDRPAMGTTSHEPGDA
ncbi:ArsR/SmtB family transcription factor [Propionibacteriaceae bacterium Y1923]|uniref:ArsR/SmtB family transcription factor n=1 Tax=Aestuariimicrobium sp. Y1814 TaxID=3418742 RepID=UPI003C1F5690